jgi:hypothetical protein
MDYEKKDKRSPSHRHTPHTWNFRPNQHLRAEAGYFTGFAVKTENLTHYTVQKVGESLYLEYWIPAEKLAEFNQNIVGLIELNSEFHGK